MSFLTPDSDPFLLEVVHYNNRSDGESLGCYGVTKVVRNGTGWSGLLLIGLDEDAPRYTDVCIDTFEQWDRYHLFLTTSYLKINLSAPAGVAKRFKMLTYDVYAPLFHRSAPCQEPLALF